MAEKDRTLAMLKAASNGANGAGGESVVDKELEAAKKDLEVLRGEKKELTRRIQKADRGWTDLMKLYKQTRKEKDSLMKDLESIGGSFEEMQDQNIRLLAQIKGREEEGNELLRCCWRCCCCCCCC